MISINCFYIPEFNTFTNQTWLHRNFTLIAHIKFALPENADVVIAVTNGKTVHHLGYSREQDKFVDLKYWTNLFSSSDDIFALTVDGETIVTYNDSNPFAINYFGFNTGSLCEDEARFYYNCTSSSDEVSIFVGSRFNLLLTTLSVYGSDLRRNDIDQVEDRILIECCSLLITYYQ